MKSPKPGLRKPKTKQRPVPYGYLRKNGRLVIDPHKKEIVKKMYGKLANHPEVILDLWEAVADFYRQNKSREAKIAYQQKLARERGH